MYNIFKFEFKTLLKSVLIWVVSASLLIFMLMAFYPTFGKDMDLLNKMMENYPEEMLKAFGMSNTMSLGTVSGFLVFAFSYVQLCLAIQSANYGFGILSIEEREFTADFLMSKPVSRSQIFFGKLLATLLGLLITLIATMVSTYISLEIFKGQGSYNFESLLWLSLGMALFQWFYLVIGLFISVLLKKIRNVLTFALGLSIGTYIINALRAVLDGEVLGYFSPFYYFDLNTIVEKQTFNYGLLTASVIMIVLAFIGAYYLYTHRDIPSL